MNEFEMFEHECPRFQYAKLMNVFYDTEALKQSIVTAVWNDDRLLRDDIEDVANALLKELKRG